MKVLVIADPHIPVPPIKYGGTERIVALLCEELTRAGHSVRLIAGRGSVDYGGGTLVHRAPSSHRRDRIFRKLWFQFLLLRAMCGVDIIINHGRLDYLHAAFWTLKPIVFWFHVSVRQIDVDFINRHKPYRRCFVFISKHQKAGLRRVNPFVIAPNAVDMNFFAGSLAVSERSYVVFLGLLSEKKGVHLAIEAARLANIRLVLAGVIPDNAEGLKFYEQKVRPNIGPMCEWIGPVDDRQKRDLLQGARALLFPIQADEAFGLVMAESLACGTPVVAWKRASTPELIRDGENGFLCENVEQLAAGLKKVSGLSRAICRASVTERFNREIFRDNSIKAVDLAKTA